MKMDNTYTKLLRSLNENKDERPVYLSVWVDNKILPGGVHDSKEAGMKHMVYGDGPDGHHLVKTTTKVLGKKREGQFVPRSVGRHLDNQPFPYDDGPHYSVHKESIDETNRGYSQAITQPLAPKEDRDRHDIVRDHEVAMRHHERQMSRDPENRSAHSAKAARHSAAFEAGKEVSFSAPGPVRDAAKKDFEVKSKKALGESVEVNEDHCLVCKDCGDELNKPTTDCKNDCSDPDGSHWVQEYNEDREPGEEYISYYDSDPAAIKKQLSLGPKGKYKNAQKKIDAHTSGKEHDPAIADMIGKRNKTNPGTNVVQLRREAVSFKEYAALKEREDEVKDGDGVNIVKDKPFKGKDMKKEPDSGKGITFANMKKSKIAKEEMSDEAKARVASLRNTPSQIAARKKAATNPAYKNTVRGTEADLNKGRPKWDQHDWDDKDAYPKESTEVDELSQILPNKNLLKTSQQSKMDKLDAELKAMRARMAEETQNEDYELTEEDLPEEWTPIMRRAAARRMKILAPRIKMGIKRSKNKTATKEKLMSRAVKQVKAALIKKLTKGQAKTDLSPGRRLEMERRIAKLGPRIKQLAQKKLPGVRKMEVDRRRNKNK